MKRFIKLGGEMISLPAIEAVLEQALSPSMDNGPSLAVEAAPGEHAELVLFTTCELERERINRHLRDAGLSPLHNIRQVRRLESIPLLGSGKTDYRALKALLARN
jgi:long-chain-fatty-acid--[acyl-carrier-protein] ligase